MDINLNRESLAMSVVCMAIGGENHLIDSFDNSRNGVHDIRFTVDGVELNFLNFIKRIDENYDKVVKKEAWKMYLERFDKRSDEIIDELSEIAERLKEIRREKFPDIDFGDDF